MSHVLSSLQQHIKTSLALFPLKQRDTARRTPKKASGARTIRASSRRSSRRTRDTVAHHHCQHPRHQLAHIPHVVAPAAILGMGSSILYHSLLQHPKSSLTPLSLIYMLLLALQTSIQPRLSKTYLPPSASKVQVALTEEVIKTSVAGVMLVSTSSPRVLSKLLWHDWSLSSSFLVAGVPAMLYAVQGVLTYQAHTQLASSVIFNGLSQTKTLWAALACWLVLGKRQSPLQILALGILLGAALLFQYSSSPSTSSTRSMTPVTSTTMERRGVTEAAMDATAPPPTSSRTQSENFPSSFDDNEDIQTQQESAASSSSKQTATSSRRITGILSGRKGVIPCLAATCLSGLAGAFSQKGLQMAGRQGVGRNAFLYTVEVSFFSALTLWLTQTLGKRKQYDKKRLDYHGVDAAGHGKSSSSATSVSNKSHRSSWTWQTYIPITTKAMGGILTALVHKHAGSVVKGFALMLGLVFSGLFQSIWISSTLAPSSSKKSKLNNIHPESTIMTSEDSSLMRRQGLPLHQVLGIILVMLSSWLHFTNPPG